MSTSGRAAGRSGGVTVLLGRWFWRRNAIRLVFLMALVTAGASAQEAPTVGREAAPIDITGDWVSLVTDEWRLRMATPARGDYRFVPLNEAGQAVADRWNPAADEAAGDSCKGYAAPAIMRLPSRLRISWEDDVTLRVDIDTGSQTRLFHFAERAPEPPSWQGRSVAQWEIGSDAAESARVRQSATLRVDTSNLRPGYLQKNGVPFSENAFMTEYYNPVVTDDGTEYLIVQIFVDDPTYLTDHWVRTAAFRRETDEGAWNPTSCSAY